MSVSEGVRCEIWVCKSVPDVNQYFLSSDRLLILLT